MPLGTCDRPSSKRPVRKSRQIVVDFTDERAQVFWKPTSIPDGIHKCALIDYTGVHSPETL